MILRYHNAINENIVDFGRNVFVPSCNEIIFKLEKSNKKQTKKELSKQKNENFLIFARIRYSLDSVYFAQKRSSYHNKKIFMDSSTEKVCFF